MFEVEELARLLFRENCQDTCVLRVDPALGYADYIIVTTCRSPRQMAGLAEYINKVYKRKAGEGEEGLSMEGAKSPSDGWVATDMGEANTSDYVVDIALHIT